jgi:hypothetical protein
MISALIGVASMAAAIQFVYYCRSALSSVRNAELSGHVLGLAGVDGRIPGCADFARFSALAQVCPEHDREGSQMRAISTYYELLRALARIRPLVPSMASWAKREQQACSHFAAVVLDRRISFSRNILLQYAPNRP